MDNILKKDREITSIMVAYGSLHYSDISIEDTFEMSIGHLYKLYVTTENVNYLQNALLHLIAFLRMGFDYYSHEDIFNKVLDGLEINKNSFLAIYPAKNKLKKLTRPQVRSMIGKWSPTANNPMKIGEVVDDIIEKVRNQEQGIHTYSYKRGNIEYVYELVISSQQCFFHDVRMKQYYFFDL